MKICADTALVHKGTEPVGRRSPDAERPQPGEPSLQPAQLRQMFTENRAEIVRFLTRRTGNSATAADLSHDVFEKLSSVQAHIPTLQKARSYLFRIAGNLAIDHRRVESRRAEILAGSQVLFEDVGQSPEDIAISRDQLRQIEKALAELPANVAQVLVLARVHGLKHKEIAEQMGVSVSLVEKYQLRALTHCRKRLDALG